MVATTAHASLDARMQNGLVRVRWAEDGDWHGGLESVADVLHRLASAAESFVGAPAYMPQSLAGAVSRKVRRRLLDAAAWCRNVVYTLVGLSMHAVHGSAGTNGATGKKKRYEHRNADTEAEYKAEVASAEWRQKRKMVE